MAFWSKKGNGAEKVVDDRNVVNTPVNFFSTVNLGNSNKIDTTTVIGQIAAYDRCVPVSVIVDKKAQAVSNAKFYVVDKDGKTIDGRKTEIVAMSNPNRFQDLHNFVSMIQAYTSLFGKCYLYKEDLGSLGFELYIVPNGVIQANVNSRGQSLNYIENIIDYTVTIGGKSMKFTKEEIFEINDISYGFNTLGDVKSRLYPLGEIVNTYVASYEAINEMMHNRGALGIISFENKDLSDMVADVRKKDEVDSIQAKLKSYGLSRNQFKFIISSRAANFTPISVPIKDLAITETQNGCIKEIARRYNISPLILDVETPKYENLAKAEIDFYDNAIIPETKNIMSKLNEIYSFDNYKVMPFFDHLSMYQLSKQQQAQSMSTLVVALDKAVAMGIMTIEEAKAEYNKFTT